MKSYFLQFDFWGEDFNKFFFGVVRGDLKETQLPDVCRQVIRDQFTGIDPYSVKIKVKAFNNIEI